VCRLTTPTEHALRAILLLEFFHCRFAIPLDLTKFTLDLKGGEGADETVCSGFNFHCLECITETIDTLIAHLSVREALGQFPSNLGRLAVEIVQLYLFEEVYQGIDLCDSTRRINPTCIAQSCIHGRIMKLTRRASPVFRRKK
jgi:hypothetical protein